MNSDFAFNAAASVVGINKELERLEGLSQRTHDDHLLRQISVTVTALQVARVSARFLRDRSSALLKQTEREKGELLERLQASLAEARKEEVGR